MIRRTLRAAFMVPALLLLLFVLVTAGALKALFDEMESEE